MAGLLGVADARQIVILDKNDFPEAIQPWVNTHGWQPHHGRLRASPSSATDANKSLLLSRERWAERVDKLHKYIATLPPDQQLYGSKAFLIIFDTTHFDARDIQNLFREITFPCPVIFQDCRFSRSSAQFDNVTFEDACLFLNCEFNSQVNFNKGTFFGDAKFDECEFNDQFLVFDNAKFRDQFSISGGSISGKSFSLDGVNVEREISLSNVKVTAEKVSLSNSQIKFGITFEKCDFESELVAITSPHFTGDIKISKSNFSGNLTLSNVTTPKSNLLMEENVVGGLLKIETCHFLSANLRLSSADRGFDLTDSRFETVPDFRNTKFERPPEVGGLQIPAPSRANSADKALAQKYRRLKSMALAANDHEKDIEFFAYEMKAKRQTEKNGIGLSVANYGYEVLSYYGFSYSRPTYFILALFLSFWAMYGFLADELVGFERTQFGFLMSIRNSIPFLGAIADAATSPAGHMTRLDTLYAALLVRGGAVDVFRWVGVIQSVLGTFFLFFFFLSVRNRFRLR